MYEAWAPLIKVDLPPFAEPTTAILNVWAIYVSNRESMEFTTLIELAS
jgi:hypothetical protein